MTREEANNKIQKIADECLSPQDIKELMRAVEALKQEPKTGQWIEMPIGFKCSKCNELEDKTTKYCPNCGARMESEK